MSMRRVARSVLRLICRCYPLKSGLSRIAFSRLFRRISVDGDLVVTRMRNGAKVLVYPNDIDGRIVYYFGDRDPKVSWVCRQVLRPGDTALDIGANYAAVAMVLGKLVGPEGVVHAFEPQKMLSEFVHVSALLNDYRHVRVHNIALSDTDGQFNLYITPGSRGEASLEPEDENTKYIVESVQVRNTSDVLEEQGVGPIRLIKIDVEGHEATVLRGADRFFAKHMPDVIVFESKQWDTLFWDRELIQLLDGYGFELFGVPRAKYSMYLDPISRDPKEKGLWHDYVAIHKNSPDYSALKSVLRVR